MFGIGFGLMLSPLTTALLSATPPTRAGLGSSVINTSRQVGSALGIAVLGAFVVQQFASNIAAQLTQRGIPGQLSATIAQKLAGAGSQASRIPLPAHLQLSQVALRQALGQAFVDALHGSFLISGIALLVTALLVALFLQQKQPATRTSVAPASVPVAAGAGAVQDIG
jgi:DHA2 family methylenomycin A resistance protein-like MFS transporter